MVRSHSTFQEYLTSLSPAEVVTEAKRFFSRQSALYPAFLDREGPLFCTFRGMGGEEIVIAADDIKGVTRVTASTYLFDMQVARFFTTLPAAEVAGVAAEGR